MNEALLAGGFALAGAAFQQVFSVINERGRATRERERDRSLYVREAFVGFVTAGRAVQRALALGQQEQLGMAVDDMAKAAAVLRLVVADDDVVRLVKAFEDRAKALQARPDPGNRLRLTPVIEAMRDSGLAMA